jgi:hypothetical protein
MFRVDLLISRGLLTVIIGSMFLFASSNLILPFYELLIGKYKLNTATSLMIMCFTTAVVSWSSIRSPRAFWTPLP